jgi:N-acetylneuraminic acid mutarotase
MFSKWWLVTGALLLVAAAGWFALSWLRQGARLEQTQRSGQKPASLPASGASQAEIPADSFRVTPEDAITTQKSVQRNLRVEMPPGLAKPKAYRFALGESVPEMRGIEGLIQTNGVFNISVETVGTTEAGAGMMLFGMGHKGHSVYVGGYHPIPKGKTLGELIVISAKPGLYKMGAAVPLGRVSLGGEEFPVTLHIFDAEQEPREKPPRHWSRGPSLRTNHAYHAAVVVEGKIYVVGGGADVEVFDPERQAWESLGKSPSHRDFPGAAALGKEIHVVGGVHRKKNLATVDVFDTPSKKWQSGARLQVARSRLAAVAWGGKLYAIGGYVGDGTEALDTGMVEEYDPGKGAWVEKAGMPTPRHGHAAVVVNNRILVIGGYGKDASGYGDLTAVEEYDPKNNRWTRKAAMASRRGFLGAAVVRGKVFAIGGHMDQSRVERYDPEMDRWIDLEQAPAAFDRFGIAAVDNDIYCVGGQGTGRQVWRFQPQPD